MSNSKVLLYIMFICCIIINGNNITNNSTLMPSLSPTNEPTFEPTFEPSFAPTKSKFENKNKAVIVIISLIAVFAFIGIVVGIIYCMASNNHDLCHCCGNCNCNIFGCQCCADSWTIDETPRHPKNK